MCPVSFPCGLLHNLQIILRLFHYLVTTIATISLTESSVSHNSPRVHSTRHVSASVSQLTRQPCRVRVLEPSHDELACVQCFPNTGGDSQLQGNAFSNSLQTSHPCRCQISLIYRSSQWVYWRPFHCPISQEDSLIKNKKVTCIKEYRWEIQTSTYKSFGIPNFLENKLHYNTLQLNRELNVANWFLIEKTV